MINLSDVKFIVVHCAASRGDITIDDIRRWHVEDNGWSDIGYHHFIDSNGLLFSGRSEAFQGAHEPKANSSSISICLAGGYKGKPNYTDDQLYTLRALCRELRKAYPMAAIVGHNQFRDDKTCPNFNVPLWWESDEIEKV